MEKNPLVFPNGADIEYAGQPHPYPYGFPNSETSVKMFEGSYRTFQSSPVSNNIMNEFIDGIRRNEYCMWMDDNVSRYTSSSNPIPNQVSNLYKSDDNRYEEWQYITLYRKFKRILTERGRCSNEMISYLICNLISIIKSDTALRNLLILSSEEFLESMLTKFVELILNDKAYDYEFSKPNEEENKINAMRKHLQRATKDASMSHSTSRLWGWNFQDQGFPFPNPMPPSKLSPESLFYVRQLRPNPLLEGDGYVPIPRLMYPQHDFHFNPPPPIRDLGPTPEPGPVKKKEPSKRYGPRGPYKRTLVRMRMREISKKRAVIRRLKSQAASTEPENSKDDLKEKAEDEKKNDIELCTTTPESELSDYNKDNDYREVNLNENEHFVTGTPASPPDPANTSNLVNTYDYVNNDKNINAPENANLEKKPDIKNFKDLTFDNFKDLAVVGKDLPNKVDDNAGYRSNLETYNECNVRNLTSFGDNYNNSYPNPGYLYQDQMNAGSDKQFVNAFYRSLNTQFNQPTQFSQPNRYRESTQFSDPSGYFDGYLQNQFPQLDSEVNEISARNNPMISSGNYQYIRPNQFNQYSIGYNYPLNQPKSIPNPSNPIPNTVPNTVANSVSSSIPNQPPNTISNTIPTTVPNTLPNQISNTVPGNIRSQINNPVNNMSNVNNGVHFSSPNILGMNSGIGMCRDQAGYGTYPSDDLLTPELNTLETEAPVLKTNRVTSPKHSKPLPDGLNDPRRRSTRLNPQINMNNVNNINKNANMRNINNLNRNMENIKNINNNIEDNLNGLNDDSNVKNNSLNDSLNKIDGINNSNSTENLNKIDGINNLNGINKNIDGNNNNLNGTNKNNLNGMRNNCLNNNLNEKNDLNVNDDTIWDMVQKHQKSGSNVNVNQTKTVNVAPKEIEFEDEDMNLLIREPVRITEDMPQNHTQPFINAYKNPKTVKWSYADTKRFYNAIETFGTDLMLVRAFLPEYTDRQIYDKFKLEERKNPQLMQNALQTHKSISLKQYEQKYGKIDTETHYNPNKDPFILEQPTDNKKSLQLNLNVSVMNQIQQAPNDKIINLFM
ncbi:hypothetical protein TpMuguga_03g00451 [Theileria parva strain Muguga]|uniref:uncharacterized protein n=1 Tax=Theileria parva strain Muguga TaxID=333668 RepID=UPI001C618A44|nr:uncharacterized protein TpMuguga_03g00451 [Theileria parva strain Muguga]EAN31188.2 hypothetical protein TpMuguga_03g00451 [Theileria parva strain Muguga]